MKTINVSELEGVALDYFVCKAAGLLDAYPQHKRPLSFATHWRSAGSKYLHPSTDWANGGPIIEKEDIRLFPDMMAVTTERGTEVYKKQGWKAQETATAYWIRKPVFTGPTPLIAAMRCYVASKLGETVEVPEELA